MGTIKMDYHQVITEAKRIQGLANSAEQYLHELKQINVSVPNVWRGAAADAFLNAGTRSEREMNELANALHIISRNLRVIAEEIKEAEERARAASNSWWK